jgi:hypothetical protein
LNITIAQKLLNSYLPISPPKTVSRLELVEFNDGAQNSSLFQIAEVTVGAADEIQITLTLSEGFTDLVGLNLVWSFCNPGAYRFSHSVQLLLAFMVANVFTVYIFHLKFDSEKWTQVFLLVLGIAGIIGANPFAYLWPDSDWIAWCDFVLPSAFVGIYRVFVRMQLHFLSTKTAADVYSKTAVTAVVFAGYAVLDVTTEIDRRMRMLTKNAPAMAVPKEAILMIADSVYIALSFRELAQTAVRNEGANFRRLMLFATALIVTNAATFLTQVWFPLQNIQ